MKETLEIENLEIYQLFNIVLSSIFQYTNRRSDNRSIKLSNHSATIASRIKNTPPNLNFKISVLSDILILAI